MDPTIGFLSFLALTVLLLVCVVITGMRGRLALHLPLVAASVVSLGGAIAYALQLGELYDLESAGWITPVHLTLAKVATGAYLLPLVTGVATLRDRSCRGRHRIAAGVALVLTVLATVTGAWMLLAAERLA
jgi:hypothetical protein